MQPEVVQPSPFWSLLPLLFMLLPSAITAYFLAKEKERSVVKWTLLGAIPFIGFFFVWFFVGAASWKQERKLEEIIERLAAIEQRG